MRATALHQKDNWYLVNLPGYEDISKQKIEVEVSLSVDEVNTLDYKSLRGAAIMERYQEKRDREVKEDIDERIIEAFDSKFKTGHIKTITDLLNSL